MRSHHIMLNEHTALIYNGRYARERLSVINPNGILPGDWPKTLGTSHGDMFEVLKTWEDYSDVRLYSP